MNVPNVLASRAVFTGVRTLSGPGAEPKRRGGAVAPSHFTVLGAAGFVGSALVAALQCAGHRVRPVTRGTLPALLETHRDAGHVIDCLAGLHFESFLFLSSTRVYARADATQEDAPLPCVPADPSDLYNLTKLAGEAICLADPRQSVRVVRLSNVYGDAMPNDTLLGQLLREGHAAGAVRFRCAGGSAGMWISPPARLRSAFHGSTRLAWLSNSARR